MEMIDSEAHWPPTADFTTLNRMWTFCLLSMTCKYLWISVPQDLDICPFKSLEGVEFSLTKKALSSTSVFAIAWKQGHFLLIEKEFADNEQ